MESKGQLLWSGYIRNIEKYIGEIYNELYEYKNTR